MDAIVSRLIQKGSRHIAGVLRNCWYLERTPKSVTLWVDPSQAHQMTLLSSARMSDLLRETLQEMDGDIHAWHFVEKTDPQLAKERQNAAETLSRVKAIPLVRLAMEKYGARIVKIDSEGAKETGNHEHQ